MTKLAQSSAKTLHREPYGDIDPRLPQLSNYGRNIAIAGVGLQLELCVASAFARSEARNIAIFGGPKAQLETTKILIEDDHPRTQVWTYYSESDGDVDLVNALEDFTSRSGPIDVFVFNLQDKHQMKDAT
jgi:hypothetical protein